MGKEVKVNMRRMKLRRTSRKLIVFWLRFLARDLAARKTGEDFTGADDPVYHWLNR